MGDPSSNLPRLDKLFRVLRVGSDGAPYLIEGEYDTIEEVLDHDFQVDRNYRIEVGGKLLTLREYKIWAQTKNA